MGQHNFVFSHYEYPAVSSSMDKYAVSICSKCGAYAISRAPDIL